MATKYISGDKKLIRFPVQSATVISTGDMVVLNTSSGSVEPLSLLSDVGSKTQNQEAAAPLFVGVAQQPSQAGQTLPIKVATGGIWEFVSTSATYAAGVSLIGPEGTGGSGNDGLSDTVVAEVSTERRSIGMCLTSGDALTRVRVALNPPPLIYGHGPKTQILCNSINEQTLASGVTIDGSRIRDGIFISNASATAETTTTPTLTAAEMFGGMVTSTQTSAVTATVDTGSAMDTALGSYVSVGQGFTWHLVNLGSASGAVTLTGATGHTVVGDAVVAISKNATIFTKRTATNTWISYRV